MTKQTMKISDAELRELGYIHKDSVRWIDEDEAYSVLINELPLDKYLATSSHAIRQIAKALSSLAIPEKKGLDEAEVMERLCQAHMKGQFDAGCKEPSYSNARADCTESVKEVCSTFKAWNTRQERLRLSEEELEKVIERHKWNTAKYVMDNQTLDTTQPSKDLAKAIIALQGKDEG